MGIVYHKLPGLDPPKRRFLLREPSIAFAKRAKFHSPEKTENQEAAAGVSICRTMLPNNRRV
jgi:hypothetical protein